MRLLLTISNLALESGGPVVSATRTAESCSQLGVETAIAYTADGRQTQPCNNVALFPLPPSHQIQRYVTSLRSVIQRWRPDIVYDFGVWEAHNPVSFLLARQQNLPWINSPRGMLEPWALQSKGLKKKIAWLSYQKHVLRLAQALVATSEQEAAQLRALLPTVPRWLVPNGVDMPIAPSPLRLAKPRRLALYLSRIDQKKQPDVLIRAWAQARPEGWHLLLVGPGEEAYRRELVGLIQRLGLEGSVELRPPVYGMAKSALLGDADLFVLPTLSENFGIAIAEALAHGLPVITTSETPWKSIAECGAGWIIPPHQDELREALEIACALPTRQLQGMGKAAIALAQKHSWCSSAEKLIHFIGDLPTHPR